MCCFVKSNQQRVTYGSDIMRVRPQRPKRRGYDECDLIHTIYRIFTSGRVRGSNEDEDRSSVCSSSCRLAWDDLNTHEVCSNSDSHQGAQERNYYA